MENDLQVYEKNAEKGWKTNWLEKELPLLPNEKIESVEPVTIFFPGSIKCFLFAWRETGSVLITNKRIIFGVIRYLGPNRLINIPLDSVLKVSFTRARGLSLKIRDGRTIVFSVGRQLGGRLYGFYEKGALTKRIDIIKTIDLFNILKKNLSEGIADDSKLALARSHPEVLSELFAFIGALVALFIMIFLFPSWFEKHFSDPMVLLMFLVVWIPFIVGNILDFRTD